MHARGEYGSSRRTWTGAAVTPPLSVALESVPKKPAPPNPLVWLVSAFLDAAAAEKHRVLGFVGGGVVGVVVGEALRRIDP